MSLANPRALITGVTGFIGSHVARRLLANRDVEVIGLVRDPYKGEWLKQMGGEVASGDLRDFGSLQRAIRGCTLVVHAAAQVSSVPDRKIFAQSNITGTNNILRAAAEAGVDRFIHLSSIAVFGLPTSGEITDQSPRGHSGDPYCDTKLDSEEVVLQAQRQGQLAITILRPSVVYGPGSTYWSVIPLKRIKKGKLLVFDGGRGLINYVYIDNLVDAILLAAEHERAVGEAFIVNDGATSWWDYYHAYARMADRNGIRSVPSWIAKAWLYYRNFLASLRREPFRVHPNALNFLASNAVYRQTAIEEKLGFHPRVGLEEGLRCTEAWFREIGLL